jgi:flagellar biosynthetic protein FliO
MRRYYLLLLFLSLPVSAAVENNATTGLLQWLLSSLFVLGLIVVLAWGLKKSRLVPQIGRPDFKVLHSLPVGYKEKLIVVTVGDQQLLLGVTAQQISFLTEIDPPLGANSTGNSAFAHHLSRWMNKSSTVEDDKS